MEKDTVTIMEDAVHNATTTRENGELRQQSKVHKHEHIERIQTAWANAATRETKL
jgi:hypothetical protein